MRNALIGLAALATATSANAGVVTFENYTVGQSIGFGSAIAGTPYPFIRAVPAAVTIGHSDAPGIGNYLSVDADPTTFDSKGNPDWDYAELFVTRFRIDADTRYIPSITSFDIFAPFADTAILEYYHATNTLVATPLPVGQWITFTLGEPLVGNGYIRVRGPFFIDNVVFEDAFEAVPEPATWATMILGFGLLGAAARRAKPRQALA